MLFFPAAHCRIHRPVVYCGYRSLFPEFTLLQVVVWCISDCIIQFLLLEKLLLFSGERKRSGCRRRAFWIRLPLLYISSPFRIRRTGVYYFCVSIVCIISSVLQRDGRVSEAMMSLHFMITRMPHPTR